MPSGNHIFYFTCKCLLSTESKWNITVQGFGQMRFLRFQPLQYRLEGWGQSWLLTDCSWHIITHRHFVLSSPLRLSCWAFRPWAPTCSHRELPLSDLVCSHCRHLQAADASTDFSPTFTSVQLSAGPFYLIHQQGPQTQLVWEWNLYLCSWTCFSSRFSVSFPYIFIQLLNLIF